jgi:hypothetical protein
VTEVERDRRNIERGPVWLHLVIYLAVAAALLGVLTALIVYGVPCDSGGTGECSQPSGQLLLALLGFGLVLVSWNRAHRGKSEQAVSGLCVAVAVFAAWGLAFDSVFH